MKMVNKFSIFIVFLCVFSALNSQNFTVQYKEKKLNIDSVILYDYNGNRIKNYTRYPIDSLYGNKLITVLYLKCKKKKICLDIDYKEILCDTVRVELDNISPKCSPKYKTIGAYHTCLGSSHMIGFFSYYYPCCRRNKGKKW